MRVAVAVVVCLVVSISVFGQSPRIKAPGQDQLFVGTGAPSGNPVSFPAHASFVTINTSIFDKTTAGVWNLDRIEDFPMPDRTTATLLVEEFSVLTASSRIVAGTKEGDKVVPAPEHILLRGTIEGEPQSHVYLAVFRDHCIGYIEQPDADRILITPALASAEGMAMPHIIYSQNDVDAKFRQTTWHCATEELPANREAIKRAGVKITKSQMKQQTPQASQVMCIGIAVDCDNDFYKDFESNLTTAQSYAIAVLGAMSDLYARDADCAIKASFLRVWQTEDPYTGHTTDELLGQFQQADISAERATALLFSGDNALGGGLAMVDVLCKGNGYAVCGMYNSYIYPTDKYVWDSDVTSHEFGHNVGSLHTHSCTWAPPVDSCVASEGGCYGTPKPVKGTVMSYCHLTPSGTELRLHKRVGNFMKSQFASSGCSDNVPVPTAKAPADKMICEDGTTSLTGSASGGTPPYKTLWFSGSTTLPSYALDTMTLLTVNASPSRTLPYVFRVTDANNVRAYDTVMVIVDSVRVDAGPNTYNVCGVDSLEITPASFKGRGKVTFEWRENASDKLIGVGPKIKVNARDTMAYRVIATDSLGCTGYDMFTINAGIDVQITALTGTGGFCDGAVDTLDAGPDFSSYKWSTGATTRTILVSTSGTYTCIVQNGPACIDTGMIVITKTAAPEKPKITHDVNMLKCPVVAASYKWYRQTNPTGFAVSVANGETQDFKPLLNGYYHVKVSNEAGCSSRSDTLLVTNAGVNDEPSILTLVRVFPNPASSSITIDAGTGPALVNLYITDMSGKIMWSAPRMPDQTQKVSIAKWTSGSYLLHYTAGGDQATAKFVKE